MSLGSIELELSPEAKQQLTAFGEAFERFTQQLIETGMLFARLCEQHRGALSLAGGPASATPVAGEAMPQVEPAQPIPPPAAAQPAGVMQTALADAALAKWTPERLAILQADYPAGVAVPDILARLLALPGIAIAHKEVAVKAAQKGWRRPAAAPDDAVVPEEAPLRKWTAARMRVLERDYPNGMVLPMLRKAINALPGLPVGESDIVAQAVAAGIRRKPVAAPPPRVTAKETLKKLSDPMIVSRDHARRWGAERGITTPTLDLEAINAKRRSLGLGAFVLER